MYDKPKFRFARLCLLQRSDYVPNILRSAFSVRPISKDSIPKIFVYDASVLFDVFLAGNEPGTDQRREFITWKVATKRRETLNIGHEQPAGNIFCCPLSCYWRCYSLLRGRWTARLAKDERAASDCDPVPAAHVDWLVDAPAVQKGAVTTAEINQPERAATF